MAEINSAPSGAKSKKPRARKLNARVDLTAMVDLAFLLITFFMLTTSLGKSRSMPLVLPEKKGDPIKLDEKRTMTILVGSHDNIFVYRGLLGEQKPAHLKLGTPQLRNALAAANKQAIAYTASTGNTGGLIVLIKPGKMSDYGNLVDVLDEMAIGNIATYAVSDPDTSEIPFLK